MLPDEIVKIVTDTISGIKAKGYVQAISSFHRIQASPGIHDAIMYVEQEMETFPNVEVNLFDYPADGKTTIGTWEAVIGWEPKSGILALIEPEEKILADFTAEPISLIAHSTSIDIESEVVFIGKGLSPEDYQGKDVKGKIVLTEGMARMVHRVACIQHGATGILTFVPPSSQDEFASLRRYDAIWPSGDEREKTTFGFALAQADGLKLKALLEEGKTVRVKAQVDAKLVDGKTEVLTALIPGEDRTKEFWVAAHICHPNPGANDNASGSGSLLEVLRVITHLLKEEKIPKLAYSIRFIWMPEWSGTIYFIDREKEILKHCIGMLNMDMVGANPAKAGSVFTLLRTPFSLPTTLNNVVRYWLTTEASRKDDRIQSGTMSPLPFKYERYGAGSDHFMLTDATVAIPAVMLNQDPDRFYHTSTDTIDKIDTRQMAYASRVAALSTLSMVLPKHVYEETILTYCRNEFIELMQQVSANGVTELSRCLGDPEKIYPRVIRWLGHAHDLGQATLDKATSEWSLIAEQEAIRNALKTSLQMVYTTEMVIARKAYEGACAEVGLEAMQEDQIVLDPKSFGIEVKRIHRHALSPTFLLLKLGEKAPKYAEMRKKEPHAWDRLDELLNMSKDWTSLDIIWDMLCFQFGDIESSDLLAIVKDLVEVGIIESRSV
ncbi:DUF4910 domain-containing protein [Candidatus Thorarchaeota archaeon]|nr:MAG: DUF4910 domain-containing protein [Candidatus Thorarchaeota archaeon]